MGLPKNEGIFDFKHTGELTSKVYEGQFTVKCVLNLAEKRALEIEKSRLTADLMNPNENLSALSTVISNLRIRVTEAPDWFNQSILTLDIIDEEVIFEIYQKCMEKSNEWLESVKSDAMEKTEGNAQKES